MGSVNGSKAFQVPAGVAPPPAKINDRKFAESRSPELESLHLIVSNRLDDDFRSRRSKRRRTTAFDSKAARKRRKSQRRNLVGIPVDSGSEKNDNGEVKIPRRVRRRAQLRMNPEKGFSTSGDGTKRLRTHVWYAKRFTMTKLWGYHLPLGLHGRGRGSRAVLKWFRDGAVVHDASYYIAVQLEGPEDSLLSILSKVLAPSPSAHSEDILRSVISGAIYDNAMLHHIGALVPKPIAPVTYMWRPCCLRNKDNNIAAESGGSDKPESTGCHSSFRQLWVWIHASAFDEGYEALKAACQKEIHERDILINCFSLEGQLGKLEIMGSKALHVLQKTLSTTQISEDSLELEKHSVPEADDDCQLKKTTVLESEENMPAKSIVSLKVVDPRAMTKERKIADVSESGDVPRTEMREHAGVAGILDENKDSFSLLSEPGDNCMFSCKNLWDASSGISPPAEESFLCKEKHDLRKKYFRLDNPNSGAVNTSPEVQWSRYCPILLLKNENKDLNIGWSVILPLSWVRAFWVPLLSKRVHAIGLREKHWIACEAGLPYFPLDFPDCNAYSCSKVTEAAASNLKEEFRPQATRPWRIPIPPPWDSVGVTLKECFTRVGDPKLCSQQKQDSGNLQSKSVCANDDVRLLGGVGNLLDGFVARTSYTLTNFLKEINADHLLLFPQVADRKTCFSQFLKDESKLRQSQKGIANIIHNRRLCFLRVLLHAYKEGSFEEGAVVCAPRLTDISLWTSRSENIEGLQMPQSAAASYFKEQPSGKWELQIPEDSIASESHRWPIGFITTGFVRGSKKPSAEAICEAVCLAYLRNEQWSEMPAKRRRKEIYVLVRNLRSTAYRLALATIVLEQQGEDVESL
ncbi:hypothetical protein UlMin_011885 [Ulmus minor]